MDGMVNQVGSCNGLRLKLFIWHFKEESYQMINGVHEISRIEPPVLMNTDLELLFILYILRFIIDSL
jgi:hypothetical protein